MSNSAFHLADSVLHRVVQILQEALLTGTDISDILRQIEVCQDSTDPNQLVLTNRYVDMVRKQHESMLKFAEEQKAKIDLLKNQEVATGNIILSK